jgi:hypothetical protein
MSFSVRREVSARPCSPLRAEVALDPLLRDALAAVVELGASPIQASWAMIGWTLDTLLAQGADPDLLAADLRRVADDLARPARRNAA